MNTHEQYEELCALAASGQASSEQLNDLRSHLEGCPSCRGATYDFTQISAQGLAQVAAKRLHCEIPTGMTQRFVARARSEGIEISRKTGSMPKRASRSSAFASLAAVAAAALVVGLLFIARPRMFRVAGTPQVSVAAKTPAPSSVPSPPARANDDKLRRDLDAAHSEIGTMQNTIQRQRTDLEDVGNRQSSLMSHLAESEKEMANAISERDQLKDKIAGLETELAKAKSDKEASDVATAYKEGELQDLKNKLAVQEATLQQQQELAARGSDVRDLVVARNLHIIDVHDRDGNGKSQRAFGRIFYTEGKSLIFYAYDLADPRKLDAKVSFYVWGERLGAEKPIRSLGVFHNDDATDGRWVLTFDDPGILAQINSVFVTAESAHKNVKEPAGKRILFAFLGDKPNHP